MTMAGFKRATKAAAKLRAAIFGPSGAGKTFTSLRVATGLGGRIAVIDTERGSASKYSDRFAFDVLELEDQSVQGYCDAIRLAADEGYAVLVIDSLSHGWQTLLEEVEKLAKAKQWVADKQAARASARAEAAVSAPPPVAAQTRLGALDWAELEAALGSSSGSAEFGVVVSSLFLLLELLEAPVG